MNAISHYCFARWTAGAMIAVMSACQAAPFVNFTLSLSNYDTGNSFTNLHAGAAGNVTELVVGFQLNITSVNGGAGFASPLAAFCTEQAESVSTNTAYRYDLVSLEKVASGQAGNANTASYLIPVGGIGLLRAARIRYLFDTYYQSSSMSAWTGGAASFEAFQLAVWEITHDTNLDIKTVSTNGVYVASQGNTVRDGIINLAQSLLYNVATANVTENYHSTKVDVWGLANLGKQDVLLGIPITMTAEDTEIRNLVPLHAPEPTALALLGFGNVWLLRRRRTRRGGNAPPR